MMTGTPHDAACQALLVEPCRVVFRDACGQNLSFPRAGRRIDAFELTEHRRYCIRPLHPRARRDPLPIEEKPQEIPRQHRFDLGAETFDRVTMHTGEQPAIAPLELARARGESSPEHDAL